MFVPSRYFAYDFAIKRLTEFSKVNWEHAASSPLVLDPLIAAMHNRSPYLPGGANVPAYLTPVTVTNSSLIGLAAVFAQYAAFTLYVTSCHPICPPFQKITPYRGGAELDPDLIHRFLDLLYPPPQIESAIFFRIRGRYQRKDRPTD